MRILQIITYRRDNETGTTHVANQLAKTLSQRNQLLYLCLGEKFRHLKATKNLEILELPSLDVGKVAIPLFTPMNISKAYKIITGFKPQVVHLHNLVLNALIGYVWAKSNSVPIVVTFHHIPTQAITHTFPQLAKNEFGKILQKTYNLSGIHELTKSVDLVIALNNEVKKSVQKISKKIKIKVLNNGLELYSLRRLKTTIPKNTYRFIFLGSYIERKNQLLLVKTFNQLPKNYQLYLYGKIKTGRDYVNGLKKQAQSNSIFIKDYVKTQNLPNVFKDKHYFISASTKEAQSLAVIQALAAGKPIIGVANETTNELVNSKNGMILSKNIGPKSFAKKILEFVKDSNYKELSKKARKDSKIFDIEKVAKETEKVYKSLI